MPTIVQVYLDFGLVVRTFDPHIYLSLITPSGVVRKGPRLSTKGGPECLDLSNLGREKPSTAN